jgi:hypothetical protein
MLGGLSPAGSDASVDVVAAPALPNAVIVSPTAITRPTIVTSGKGEYVYMEESDPNGGPLA